MPEEYNICIVVPAYNEEVGIKHFVLKLDSILAETGLNYTISVADDGSADNTWEVLKSLHQEMPGRLKASRFSRNFGKDAAVFAAIEAVNAQAYIILDADGQHPPELIPEFIKLWQEGSYDIINGIKETDETVNPVRKFVSGTFNYIFKKLSGLSIMQSSDFKLITRRVAEEILKCGDYYIFFRALTTWVGFKQIDFKFRVKEREMGVGKWPILKLFNYAINAILLYSYVPLYILLVIGGLALILSFLLFLKLIIFYFLGEVPTGYSTVISLMLLILSINVISVGIIGLYLQKVLEQVKFRPRYIVMDKIQ